MADITLAECQGNTWLIGGEAHFDDLLANTLPRGVSIEIVACSNSNEVRNLWRQHGGDVQGGDPWIINPAIVARARRNAPDHAIFFAQWSANLDDDALAVIDSAVIWANENPGTIVSLIEFVDPEAPSMVADISRLRRQLIEQKLADAGLKRERFRAIVRPTAEVPGMGQESQRIDIAIRPEHDNL